MSHAVDAAVAAGSAPSRRGSARPHWPSTWRPPCAGGSRTRAANASFPEPQWLAPAFRWALILDDLKTLDRRTPGAGRHPQYRGLGTVPGRPIPGETCARQIGVVQRWYDADQRDAAGCGGIAFGTVDPAAVETAVGARASDEDWEQRLSEALDEFHDCRWPLDYLRGSTAAGTGGETWA